MAAEEIRAQKLPDDVEVLKRIILQQAQEIAQLKGQNERLQHLLGKLQRYTFGSRSQTVPEEQLIFPFVEGLAVPERENPPERSAAPDSRPAKRNGQGHGRRLIPAGLPRIVQVYDVPEEERSCDECGRPLEKIGEEVSEELDLEPEKIFVRRRVRPKLACRSCQGSVKIAELPPRIIEKGLAGPGLLASILIGKYADHAPLYRQEQIFARHGIEIPRSTMCGWISEVCEQLEPLYKAMHRDVLQSEVLNSDDTPMPVLEPGLGKTRQGRFWVYRGDAHHTHTVYEYTPDRKQEHVANFLNGYRGVLQGDAYAGYKKVEAKSDEEIILVGCWAHARRYFFEAKETDSGRALAAMGYIRRLYEVEWEADEKELEADDRKDLRQKYSVPILKGFKKWLDEQMVQVLPKSPIGEAIGYVLGQWPTLLRYTEDGRIPIDNNSAERSLKPVVIGRKNYLFMGSDEGGRRAAMIYTLIESCRQNVVEPWKYLRDIMQGLPTWPIKRILELAPFYWKKKHQSLAPDTS
jgi:transposase